jgi:hypothetical protein
MVTFWPPKPVYDLQCSGQGQLQCCPEPGELDRFLDQLLRLQETPKSDETMMRLRNHKPALGEQPQEFSNRNAANVEPQGFSNRNAANVEPARTTHIKAPCTFMRNTSPKACAGGSGKPVCVDNSEQLPHIFKPKRTRTNPQSSRDGTLFLLAAAATGFCWLANLTSGIYVHFSHCCGKQLDKKR